MRKTGRLFLPGFLVVAAATALSGQPASAACGAFNLLQGDDFCLRCPSTRPEKLYVCPGGPAGMMVASTSHPHCSITMYDPSCGDRATRKKPH